MRGCYASTDGGNTWPQINNSARQWCYYSGYVITGVPNRFGCVYIAHCGIIYGDGTP